MSFLLALCLLSAPDTLELTLDAAVRTAFGRSPAAVSAGVARTQAGTALAGGLAALLPTASGNLSYGKSTSPYGSLSLGDSSWSWSGTLTLSQVVFDPAVFAGVVSAFGYYRANRADARAQTAQLLYDVTAGYLNLVRAGMLGEAAAAAVRRAEAGLKLTEERHRLRSASDIDLMRAQVQESQSRIDLLAADKARALAESDLKAQLGIAGPEHVRAVDSLAAAAVLPLTNPDSLVAEIERRNPGLASAAGAKAAADANLVGTIGRLLPSVSGYWSSAYADSGLPTSVRQWDDHDVASYGLRFAFPLLDIKSYVLGVVNAGTEARRADAALATARLRLASAARAAVLGYDEAVAKYQVARQNLELNQRLYQLAQDQYRLGALSLTDLASVEVGLSQAQAAHVSALCDTHIQAALLSYLLGRTDPGRKE